MDVRKPGRRNAAARANTLGETAGTIHLPGVDLFYRCIGSGPPVVLVHGGPGLPHDQLRPACDRLAGAFSVWYYDQRGCGRSGDPTPPEALGWEDHLADLIGVLDFIGAPRAGLVGFSWGAFLALQLAIHHPDRLACLAVIGATGVRADGWRAAYAAARARRQAELQTVERLRALAQSGLRERDPAAYRRERYWLWAEAELADPSLVRRLPPLPMDERGEIANALALASLDRYDLRPALRRLRLPALVLHGRHDLRPLALAQEIAGAIPGAELVVCERSGHLPFFEEPETFFTALSGFLSRHLGER